jgi:hypothetical protein
VTAAVEDECVKRQHQSPAEVASRSPVDISLQMALSVTLKVATLVYRCLHEAAPRYLSSALHRVADVDSRRRLRSSADTQLLVTPRSRLITAGDCSFLVAGPRIWNSLPYAVRAAPSLLSFKQRLKIVLFSRFYS